MLLAKYIHVAGTLYIPYLFKMTSIMHISKSFSRPWYVCTCLNVWFHGGLKYTWYPKKNFFQVKVSDNFDQFLKFLIHRSCVTWFRNTGRWRCQSSFAQVSPHYLTCRHAHGNIFNRLFLYFILFTSYYFILTEIELS